MLRLRHGVTDGLGRVDDRTTAHRQNELRAELTGQLRALPDLGYPGVWHHASQGGVGNARPVQGGGYPVQQAGLYRAAPAVVDEHPADAQLTQQRAGALLRVPAKDDPGGCVVFKVEHGKRLLNCCFGAAGQIHMGTRPAGRGKLKWSPSKTL